jgi:hypothetical protein
MMRNQRLFLSLFLTALILGCSQPEAGNEPYIDVRVPDLATPNGAGGSSPQRQWYATGKEVPALAGLCSE